MDDTEKIDEITLAPLYLVMWKEHVYHRAWKGFDWNTLIRLHDMGLIADPKSKAKSIAVSVEGYRKAEELFKRHFEKQRGGDTRIAHPQRVRKRRGPTFG